jgi:hypothetical protein
MTGLACLQSGIDLMQKFDYDSCEKVDKYFLECPHRHYHLKVVFLVPLVKLTPDLGQHLTILSTEIQESAENTVAHGPREWYSAVRIALTSAFHQSDLNSSEGLPFFNLLSNLLSTKITALLPLWLKEQKMLFVHLGAVAGMTKTTRTYVN